MFYHTTQLRKGEKMFVGFEAARVIGHGVGGGALHYMLSTEGMIYAHNSKRVLGLILDVLVEEYCLRAQVFPKLCNHRTIKKKRLFR